MSTNHHQVVGTCSSSGTPEFRHEKTLGRQTLSFFFGEAASVVAEVGKFPSRSTCLSSSMWHGLFSTKYRARSCSFILHSCSFILHSCSFILHSCSFIFIHSLIQVHSYVHSFIHSVIQSFSHSVIHSFIHPFIHSSIHSLHSLYSLISFESFFSCQYFPTIPISKLLP